VSSGGCNFFQALFATFFTGGSIFFLVIVFIGSLIALTGNDKKGVLAMLCMDKNRIKRLEYFSQQIEEQNLNSQ
jgi:hypothetical protein